MYIHPHKKTWKDEYNNESNLILSSYGEGIKLHHIGSTAIEGLYAKDCIDILGVVEDLSEMVKRKNSIVDLGYIYNGEYGIAGREYFSKSQRKAHLHIFKAGDTNINKHLFFVQIMRGNTQLIKELNTLKKHLQQKYPSDKDAYQREKEFFYNKIEAIL
jgi:GrpB-like predicted nucleotidyltransferase (UPF0157 family)